VAAFLHPQQPSSDRGALPAESRRQAPREGPLSSPNGLVNIESSRKEAHLKAAQPQPRSQVCDFFVSNIYVSRVDVADKETKPSLFERHLNGQSVRASGC